MKKQQSGVTLIELMISMVLGLALISGIGSLFLQMQKSNKVLRAYSAIADESGYVLEVLQKEIRRAGGLRSQSDLNGARDKVFISRNNVLASGLDFATAEYIKGDATAGLTNDAFIIRYQLLDATDLSTVGGSNGNSPCTQNVLLNAGEDPAAQEHVVSVYFSLNASVLSCTAQRAMQDIKNTGSGVETCIANCTSATDYTPIAGQTVDLISNVVRLRVSYGVDSDSDNAANFYVNAANVPTSTDWEKIVSVRLSVVVRSEEDHLTDTIANYKFEGVGITPIDHRLYKTFTTTIALRNRLL